MSTVVSNGPLALDRFRFRLAGMSSGRDARRLERRLARLDGVQGAEVRFEDEIATITVLDRGVDPGHLLWLIRTAGFEAALVPDAELTPLQRRKAAHSALATTAWRTAAPAGLAVGLAVVHWGWRQIEGTLPVGPAEGLLHNGQLLLTALVFWSGRSMFEVFLTGAAAEQLRREVPLGLAAIAAALASAFMFLAGKEPAFFVAASIVATHHVGVWLESWLLRRAEAHFEQLQQLRPREATVRRGDRDYALAIGDLEPGDRVVVPPGGRIPVDGTVRAACDVDEAALLGEGGVECKPAGAGVYAGTTNRSDDVVVVEAERIGDRTILGRLLDVVERARSTRSARQKQGDRLAALALPLALVAALLTMGAWLSGGAAFWDALSPALAVLITLTPWVLGFASVPAVTAGMTGAARHGVLCRDAAALERVSGLTVLAHELTGGFTTGHPRVDSFETFGLPAADALILVAALERRSEHPMATAMLEYARRELGETGWAALPEPRSFRAIPGRGVIARIAEQEVVFGGAALMEGKGIEFPGPGARGDWLYLAVDGRFRARAHVCDPLRPDARATVDAARAAGMTTVLLAGDSDAAETALAVGVEPSKVRAGLERSEHAEVVRVLQAADHRVGLVGRAGPDNAALDRADVGFALRDGELPDRDYDVLLLRPGAGGVATALAYARETARTVRQNLGLSLAAMLLCIPAATGWLPPTSALLLLLAALLGVGLNALKLEADPWAPPEAPIATRPADAEPEVHFPRSASEALPPPE